jgi:hypothetical protein
MSRPRGLSWRSLTPPSVVATSDPSVSRRTPPPPSRAYEIVRVGQMAGGKAGDWNAVEWLSSLLASGPVIKCLQDLPSLSLSIHQSDQVLRYHRTLRGFPFDGAARAMLDFTLADATKTPGILHLVHPRPVPWAMVVRHVSEFAFHLCRTRSGCVHSRMNSAIRRRRWSTYARILRYGYSPSTNPWMQQSTHRRSAWAMRRGGTYARCSSRQSCFSCIERSRSAWTG